MIDGVNSTANSIEYAAKDKSAMDKDAFLKLMIAQLQNQDPLEPMDGTDYSAQLAQFSSLEQLQNINDNLNTSIDANYLLTQSINNTMTAGLIGKEAKIASNEIKYNDQESVKIGYDLIADASEMEMKIYDENHVLVKTITDLDLNKGQHKLSWDFTDDNGKKVNPGDYTVTVEAKNMTSTDMKVAQYLVGEIDGVRYSASGTSLVINGVEYAVSDVFEIVNGGSDSSVAGLTNNNNSNSNSNIGSSNNELNNEDEDNNKHNSDGS